MKVIIDRFEGEYAVVELEQGGTAHISAVILAGAKEGDVVSVEVDESETQKRRGKIKRLMDEVWND